MGGNKDNMRQAMKELLGLVGFGPDEELEGRESAVEQPKPTVQAKPETVERKPAAEAPKTPERPVVHEPKVEREPAVERPAAQAPKIEREPAVERPVVQTPKVEQPAAPQRPAAQQRPVEQPKAETFVRPAETTPEPEPTDLEETRRRVASTVERSFFPFGGRKIKEKEKGKEREPVFTNHVETPYVPPVERPETPPVREIPVEEDTVRPPFIRPGATVIAAGATFFGDIRAEGDVEVLGKLKGNLEATGNVRVVGKVLGDVKGEAVVLDGCTVQGNITSTSFVTLDAGAMVVGDVLATDFTSDGKVKGNLQIARAANFSSCALLAGNVIAATIMMAQGARVQGAVRIAEDPETNALFGELEI